MAYCDSPWVVKVICYIVKQPVKYKKLVDILRVDPSSGSLLSNKGNVCNGCKKLLVTNA